MRIVVVDHAGELGGAQLAVLHTLAGLPPGHDVLALVGRGPYARALAGLGVTVGDLVLPDSVRDARRSSRVTPRAAMAGFSASRDVAHRLRGHARGDVVLYINSPKALLLCAPLLLLRRPAAVFHARDVLDESWVRSRAVRGALRAALRLVDVVIANGTAAASALPTRCEVVPSPVAAEMFEDVVPPPPSPPVLVMAGRLDPWKGQDLFLRALSEVRRSRPDVGGVVVGGPLFGRSGYESDLHRLARDLGLLEAVRFTGQVPSVRPYLDAGHVSVVATRGVEPFGQVVVQSLARGRLVVAPCAGGPAEMVQEGSTGALFRPGEIASMVDAIHRALDLVSPTSAAAAREAASAFDPRAAVARTNDCLATASRRARAGGWARRPVRGPSASRNPSTTA